MAWRKLRALYTEKEKTIEYYRPDENQRRTKGKGNKNREKSSKNAELEAKDIGAISSNYKLRLSEKLM